MLALPNSVDSAGGPESQSCGIALDAATQSVESHYRLFSRSDLHSILHAGYRVMRPGCDDAETVRPQSRLRLVAFGCLADLQAVTAEQTGLVFGQLVRRRSSVTTEDVLDDMSVVYMSIWHTKFLTKRQYSFQTN
jgi:hypothetical protein